MLVKLTDPTCDLFMGAGRQLLSTRRVKATGSVCPGHRIEENPDWYYDKKGTRKPPHACKLCSILKPKRPRKKKDTAQTNAEECADGDAVEAAPAASDATNAEGSAGADDGVSEDDTEDDAGATAGGAAAKKKRVPSSDSRHPTKYYCGACSEGEARYERHVRVHFRIDLFPNDLFVLLQTLSVQRCAAPSVRRQHKLLPGMA